jgi:hypothetical protein
MDSVAERVRGKWSSLIDGFGERYAPPRAIIHERHAGRCGILRLLLSV